MKITRIQIHVYTWQPNSYTRKNIGKPKHAYFIGFVLTVGKNFSVKVLVKFKQKVIFQDFINYSLGKIFSRHRFFSLLNNI